MGSSQYKRSILLIKKGKGQMQSKIKCLIVGRMEKTGALIVGALLLQVRRYYFVFKVLDVVDCSGFSKAQLSFAFKR